MSRLFNLKAIRSADIVHSFSAGKASRLIQKSIGSVGTHDALILGGDIGIGESIMWPPFAGITPVSEYEKNMLAGRCKVAVLRVPDLQDFMAKAVVSAWIKDVRGTFYDFAALPRLWFKARFADCWPRAAGWEWAYWCTEGLRRAFLGGSSGSVDPWMKTNPTPKTTENRLKSGFLVDVSSECLSPDGLQYRLVL